MTAPRYAKLAARLLGREHEAAVSREGARARMSDASGRAGRAGRAGHAGAVDAIERALREKGRRRARTRWITGIAAAAAALAVTGGGVLVTREARLHAATASVTSATSVAPVMPGHGPSVEGTAPADVASASRAEPANAQAVVGKTGGDVTVTAPGSTSSVADGKPLAAGSRVTTRAGGRALLAFSTGTELAVEEGSDMTIVEEGATQVFALAGGAVRADVAKLHAGQRFLVRTADAEVEVRGTSFRVAVAPSDPACGGGTSTRVAVFEGTVVVRNAGIDWTVTKGESWPEGCVPARHVPRARAASGASGSSVGARERMSRTSGSGALALAVAGTSSRSQVGAPVATTAAPQTGAVPEVAPPSAAPSPAAPVASSASSGSTLAEQNDRFAAAIAAKRSGDAPGAIAAFERFVAAYPASPLAESALVERMKLLASTDRARGAAAARQYLARYPGGFARSDAEAIAAVGP